MEKYKTDTQEINDAVFPTPDTVANVIAEESLATIKRNGGIISREILKDAVLAGFAKLELATITDDDDEQGAPVDPAIVRKEIHNAITKSIFESLEILDMPKKPFAVLLATNAAVAAEEIFDKYFIR